mgnify:CR=1 FL=1
MKQRRIIAILAMVLVLVLAIGLFAACDKTKKDPKTYTYLDSFQTSPSTWNPHTYRTNDDAYVNDFTYSGLYEFFFNEDKTGYEVWPVMAAAEPVDITSELKSVAKWAIPAEAESGYAYKIALNQNAKWDDGTVINADTYVESMKRLLSPNYVNYRASGYFTGSLQIFGAKDYFYQGAPTTEVFLTANGDKYTNAEGVVTGKTEAGVFTVKIGEDVRELYVNVDATVPFFGASMTKYYDAGYESYFCDADGNDLYKKLQEKANKYGLVAVTDEVIADLTTIAAKFGDDNTVAWNEFCLIVTGTGAEYSWDNVGIYKSGDYEITLVFNKSLSGFYLLYNLSSNWIVNIDKYDAGLSESSTGVWSNTYNTNVATAAACGPYKLTTYQEGKLMEFSRNENWIGYSDSRFAGMYQATGIKSVYASEASTRKQMFLKGELDTYGLQPEDYADYRMSDYFYTSPGTTIFFLTLSSSEGALKAAEKEGVDKEIIANDKFRKALSLSFDKDAFAAAISPARSGAFSVIGAYDIWNPSTGEKYRDTDIAKAALAEYYGFTKQEDGSWKLASSDKLYTLDEAVKAITGYDPETAKALFLEAYQEQLDAGKISATDKIEIEYALSNQSSFIDKTLNYLNEQINAVLAGTVLENRVSITQSAPVGNDWSSKLREGTSQTSLCGWEGGMLDPFSSMLYYLYPEYDPYAEMWWDTTKTNATMTLPVGENGADVEITMTLEKWGLCLTGDAIKVGDKTYNFGYEQVADSVRLQILANLEKEILSTNYYIPMLQDGSGFLLTQKVNYALGPDDYNAVLKRGGIAYMTFNYTDKEWADYVASQNGTLKY